MLVGKSNFWSRGIKLFICSSIFSYKKHFVGATHHVLDLGKGLFQNIEKKTRFLAVKVFRREIRCDLNFSSEKCEKCKKNKVNSFIWFYNFFKFISILEHFENKKSIALKIQRPVSCSFHFW